MGCVTLSEGPWRKEVPASGTHGAVLSLGIVLMDFCVPRAYTRPPLFTGRKSTMVLVKAELVFSIERQFLFQSRKPVKRNGV